MTSRAETNIRPQPDRELRDIADYVTDYVVDSEEALSTARYALMDSIGCALVALKHPECTRLLGPVAPGTSVPLGTRIPGTPFELDPVQAAFDIGTLIRWLDYNDTWLAAEWSHPSDNIGGILAVSDFVSRKRIAEGMAPLIIRNVLVSMIKAYEIQGVLSLENSFNSVGLDHVVLVKVATAAITTALLGGDKTDITNTLSQAWIDGQSLRTYRHAPNTGSRKSWAAGDATARGVWLALITMKGETGYPGALTAKKWGFYDALFQGRKFILRRTYGSYVMENILWKVAFPSEFHAQTAAECAFRLHNDVRERLDEIEKIVMTTQEPAIRIISKKGPLYNPADRDHCLQYVVAVVLIYGELTYDYYSDQTAADPRIDFLRGRMEVVEDTRFSREYLDQNRRSVANALQVFFTDGTHTKKVQVEYPVGHPKRRREGIPLLIDKFRQNSAASLPVEIVDRLSRLFSDRDRLEKMSVPDFMKLLWRG
ncbi:MAG: bifunctional 2-methylcitrate dehydratase/aconitate hydratase [Candidatus Sulfobium sp.]|jgi:2-methylcitrate dehydratase